MLEQLGLTSTDLVDRFEDIIEEKYEELIGQLEELINADDY